MKKKETLTAEQVVELQNWTPDFLQLPVHRELDHQFRLCLHGVEHAVVIGQRGVGKTHSVQWMREELEAEEAARTLADPAYEPREIVYYATSGARGAKTSLIDLYERLFGSMSKSALRFHTATSLLGHIVNEVVRRRVALICVDEAQMIDGPNLDLLRQVPDGASEVGHSVGLVLVGSEELRESLVEIKQLGQRFSAEVRFPRITRSEVGAYLPGFHPHLPILKEAIMGKAWDALEAEIFDAAQGKFRRLITILRNANALALRFNRSMDEQILRLAIGKLAPEV